MDMTESFMSMFSSKPTEKTKQTTPVLTEKELRLPVGALQHMTKLEEEHGLQPGILLSITQQESGSSKDRANARSGVGAQGWFQFMPKTAEQYKVTPSDFYSSSSGAARYLSDLKKQFDGDSDKMIAAYNWGQGNVSRKGLENMPVETRDYLKKVKDNLNKFGGYVADKVNAQTKEQSQNPKAGFPLFNMTQDAKKLFGIQDI